MSTRSLTLVPVEDSAESEATLEYAIRIAQSAHADIHVIHVVPHGRVPTRGRAVARAVRARLLRQWPLARRAGVRLQLVTLHGPAVEVIPAHAELHAASLIVIGRSYGSSRFLRHSGVVGRLARRTSTRVLVAPIEAGFPGFDKLTHVLAAVDFTVASAKAVTVAAELSRWSGGRLSLLHAMTPRDGSAFSGGEARRFARRARAEASTLAERLRRKASAVDAPHAEPVIVTGSPARGIVEAAEAADADLIVMGVAPRTWRDALVSTSTLRSVLRRARAAVLVLPVPAGRYEWVEVTPEEVSVRIRGIAARAA